MAGHPWVPHGAMCACVRVPPLAQGLFVFLLIGLFFHVHPTKPHVFPLISPARLGWSPQHAQGLPSGPERRRGGLPTPLARPAQAGWGRVTLPAPALPGLHPHSSCLASKPYIMTSLKAPQLLASQMPLSCLPPVFSPPRHLHPQAALSFSAHRAEGEAALHQGF